MESKLISICISVHNTEKYLPRCLDSLINQTELKSIEIVLVNNGSSDNSESIMYEYQEKYKSIDIKILSQEDRGLAQGRKTGVVNANGKYIMFLDADDYLYPNAIKRVKNIILKSGSDIIEFKTIRDKKVISSDKSGIFNTDIILHQYMNRGDIPPMLWMRAYKKALFTDKVFPDLYVNNEDVFIFPCLLYSANNIEYIDEVLHVYSTDNEKGFMNELNNNTNDMSVLKKRLISIKHTEHIKKYLDDKGMKKYEDDYLRLYLRVCEGFCLYSYKSISDTDVMKELYRETNKNNRDFQILYSNIKCKKTLPHIFMDILGFERGILIFKKLYRLKEKMEGRI